MSKETKISRQRYHTVDEKIQRAGLDGKFYRMNHPMNRMQINAINYCISGKAHSNSLFNE